ncbi:glycosyltransferase [Aquabacterium sp.]|uniref:glycosyltransferase n=1 Tax=Aquabacterium sp. TaxID=1872578 RepID=UPI0025C48E06|nr:glycosyltransferase [Aquabacterium sp.]
MRLEGTTGLQTHMREFEAFLREHGLPHEVATPFYTAGAPLLYLFVGWRRVLEVVCKPAAVWLYRSGHALLLWWRLRGLMARHPRCVVYAQCPLSVAVAMRCVRFPDQVVTMVVHFNLSQADEWIDKGYIAPNGSIARGIRDLEQSVLPRLQGMVYVSRFMQNELIRKVPSVQAVRSAVIPNFVKALPAGEVLEAAKERNLVSIGTLEPRKNQQFLLHVLAQAKSRGRVLTLTLVGDGPDRGALEALALQLGVAEQVFFAGFSAGARAFIPGHQLYVHAARMENLPLVLIEALSAGVPILAGAVGGIVEVFNEGVEGRFWPLDDPSAACDIVLDVLEHEGRLNRMGRAASARFKAVFESAVVGQRLHDFLLSRP